jgi:hypothetical protein
MTTNDATTIITPQITGAMSRVDVGIRQSSIDFAAVADSNDQHAQHFVLDVAPDRDQVQTALERLRERARQLAKENPGRAAFDWEEIKKLRDEGRR